MWHEAPLYTNVDICVCVYYKVFSFSLHSRELWAVSLQSFGEFESLILLLKCSFHQGVLLLLMWNLGLT